MPHVDQKKESGEMHIIKFNFGSRYANIISDSAIMLVCLCTICAALRPAGASKTISECSACLGARFVAKETGKHQRYKGKTGDFPVPVGRGINQLQWSLSSSPELH